MRINASKPNSSHCYTLPYRHNLPFLISDIRALWRPSAQMSWIKKRWVRPLCLWTFEV